MRTYKNRACKSYQNALKRALSLKIAGKVQGPEEIKTLLESAQQIRPESSKKNRFSEIAKIINIDLMAMTGETLLSTSRHCHVNRIERLADKVNELNARGFAVRIRFLLQHPYSVAAQNRIHAEHWTGRPFIGDFDKGIHRRQEWILAQPLDGDSIEPSPHYRDQISCIRKFIEIRNKFASNDKDPSQTPNRFEMRFAFMSILTCALRVNGRLWIDPYHYGKRQDSQRIDTASTPMIELHRETTEDHDGYDAMCNHFQFLWQHDSTMDFEDAISETLPDHQGIVRINHPKYCSFDHKTGRIRSSYERISRIGGTKIEMTNDSWFEFQKGLRRTAKRLSPTTGVIPGQERGFIVGAWDESSDGSMSIVDLANFIRDTLNYHMSEIGKQVSIDYLEARVGQSLSTELSQALKNATFGVVILRSNDGAPERPNVYIETGFLLSALGPKRVFIIPEDGAIIPSDLSDLIRCQPFKPSHSRPDEARKFAFLDLINCMKKNDLISVDTFAKVNMNLNAKRDR